MTNRELHYRYGISYLLTIIVALTALGLFDVPNLVDKISFALTIASLLLAVVAIIYTFLAGNKQDGQLTKLVETHYSISAAAGEIKQAAGSLLGHVATIPSRLEQMTQKIDSLSLPEAAKLVASTVPSSDPTLNQEQFKRFLTSLPFAAMSVIYAFYVASRNGRVLSEVSMSNWAPVSFEFAQGVLWGAKAAALIDFKFHKSDIVPVSCSKVLEENLKPLLERIAEVISEEQRDVLKMRMAQAESEFD